MLTGCYFNLLCPLGIAIALELLIFASQSAYFDQANLNISYSTINQFKIIKCATMRENLSSGVCKQHRRRPACASAQSDQRLCYSRFGKYHTKTCYR